MAKKNLVLSTTILIILFYIPVFFLPNDTLLQLTNEDGPYESLGALFFFLAFLAFLLAFVQKRNLFFLLFAILFFFAAGEEISWGQRILSFQTPAVMQANNAQNEFNLHNINVIQHGQGVGSSIQEMIFNFNRLFILFCLGYCILVPLASRYFRGPRNLFLWMRLPILTIWFGVIFLLNEITSKTLEVFVVDCQSQCPKIYEIKETVWALLVLSWGIYFLFTYASTNKATAPVDSRTGNSLTV
jgi:hypothetical protein